MTNNRAAREMSRGSKFDWLYVAKRQGKLEFIKAFESFDPVRVEWTNSVGEAAEFTESEWEGVEGAIEFILSERLCLVSYADEPKGKRRVASVAPDPL